MDLESREKLHLNAADRRAGDRLLRGPTSRNGARGDASIGTAVYAQHQRPDRKTTHHRIPQQFDLAGIPNCAALQRSNAGHYRRMLAWGQRLGVPTGNVEQCQRRMARRSIAVYLLFFTHLKFLVLSCSKPDRGHSEKHLMGLNGT